MTSCRAGTSVDGNVHVSDVARAVTVPALRLPGARSGLVAVVDELLDERCGLLDEKWAVLDGEPPGEQDGLSDDSVRGEMALHGVPAAGAVGLVLRGHRSAGRMPLMMAQ